MYLLELFLAIFTMVIAFGVGLLTLAVAYSVGFYYILLDKKDREDETLIEFIKISLG